MTKISKLMRTTWYPRPHDFENSYMHGIETGVDNQATIYPIMMYDEGLGAPDAYNAHPENSSFATAGEPNCFVESRVNTIKCNVHFSLTKACLETDKIHAVRCAFMPIFMAFKDNYTAIDEVANFEVQDSLEMQFETTDRQGYPLYNGVKMANSYTNSGLLPTNVPGLTATQIIEGVPFVTNAFYDSIHWLTISGKVKGSVGGLKWFTLTRSKPVKRIKIFIKAKVKRMNPYTFCGLLTIVPKVDTPDQYAISGETTNVNHVKVDINTRFNEWNQDYDFGKV